MNNLMIWEVAPTKSEIEVFAAAVANELAEGITKPEDVAVKMAAMESFVKSLRAKAEEHIIDFLNKCPKDRKSTRLNSSHIPLSRMPSSA